MARNRVDFLYKLDDQGWTMSFWIAADTPKLAVTRAEPLRTVLTNGLGWGGRIRAIKATQDEGDRYSFLTTYATTPTPAGIVEGQMADQANAGLRFTLYGGIYKRNQIFRGVLDRMIARNVLAPGFAQTGDEVGFRARLEAELTQGWMFRALNRAPDVVNKQKITEVNIINLFPSWTRLTTIAPHGISDGDKFRISGRGFGDGWEGLAGIWTASTVTATTIDIPLTPGNPNEYLKTAYTQRRSYTYPSITGVSVGGIVGTKRTGVGPFPPRGRRRVRRRV